jgi:hypothetical protein
VVFNDAIRAVRTSTNDNDIYNNYYKSGKSQAYTGRRWMKSDRVKGLEERVCGKTVSSVVTGGRGVLYKTAGLMG